jgi:hypothetical protein
MDYIRPNKGVIIQIYQNDRNSNLVFSLKESIFVVLLSGKKKTVRWKKNLQIIVSNVFSDRVLRKVMVYALEN